MTNVKDVQSVGTSMRGFVTGRWFNPVTGESRPAFARRNQLSYAAADAMAQLLAGNSAYAPRYIGFIYGDADSVPAALSDPTLRVQTMAGLATELAATDGGVKGNMQIAPMTLTPTVAVDGDETLYRGNSAIFTAHTTTGAGGTYAFPLAAPYAGLFDTGSFLFHAVLLVKLQGAGGIEYVPVARVTLGEAGPVYLAKPEGFELALDWQVSFF